MPEQVILEFIGDPSGLKPVADAMSALGKLTDAQRQSLAKASADFNTRKAAIVAGEKASADAIGKTTTAIKGEASALEQVSVALGDISKSVSGGAIKGVSDSFKKAGSAIADAVTKTTSLKAQLRSLKNELNTLDEGSARFKKLSVEAAKLEDKIGDVNEQVRVLASDTFGLDAVVDGVKGLTAAYSLAQGASALLGEENEDIQKALVKINALMLVSTSLQEVANQVKGQGAAKLAILSAATKVYTFVTTGATVVTKALRAALVATGLGAIVFVVYEAAKAFGLFSDAVDTNSDATKENTKDIHDNTDAINERQKSIDDYVNSVKFSGQASYDKQKELDEKLLQLKDNLTFAELLRDNEKGAEQKAILQKQYDDVVAQIKILNDEKKRLYAEDAKAVADAEKAKKESMKPTEMLEQIEEGYRQQYDALQRKIDAEIEAERKAIEDKKQLKEDAAKAEIDNETELMKHIEDLHKKKDEEIAASEAKVAALKEELRQAELQAVGILVSTIFTITNANRAAEFEAQLKYLSDLRTAELDNENLTEAQKAAINDKYRKQEAEIKRQQFEKDRAAKIIEATIATALAVVKALPNYIAAALAGVAGAAQIAVIASQPVPQFATGTEYVYGAGTGTSDSIHAKLSKGERVVPAKINEQLAGIPNSELPRLAAFAGMLPNIPSDILSQYASNQSATFDYKLLAKELGRTLEGATKPSISIDRSGINILLTKGNQSRTYLNNRYLSK